MIATSLDCSVITIIVCGECRIMALETTEIVFVIKIDWWRCVAHQRRYDIRHIFLLSLYFCRCCWKIPLYIWFVCHNFSFTTQKKKYCTKEESTCKFSFTKNKLMRKNHTNLCQAKCVKCVGQRYPRTDKDFTHPQTLHVYSTLLSYASRDYSQSKSVQLAPNHKKTHF